MNAELIQKILSDLQQHKREKSGLMIEYVNDRLNKSLESYYKELEYSLTYLSGRDEKNILRKMSKDNDVQNQ